VSVGHHCVQISLLISNSTANCKGGLCEGRWGVRWVGRPHVYLRAELPRVGMCEG